MTDRPLDIALLFHSAVSDNMGVGALTVAEIAILRAAAAEAGCEIRITIIDWKDPRPPYVDGPDVTIRQIRGKDIADPRKVFALLRKMDMVVDIGAGDSFADIYGSRRLNRLFALKYLTHLAGKPLVVAPQTVGPFTRKRSQVLARVSLGRSAIVATRDGMSTRAAREIGVTRDILEVSDVALRLPYTAPDAPRADGPVRVGLNVSGLLMRGGYTGKNMFGLRMDYPSLMKSLIARFQAHPAGCEVHLVPHVLTYERGAVEDDYQASLDLAAELEGLTVAPAFTSPSEAKSYIAGMDFFAGARMHACIAAFSSGVPVVPMAYSRKFAGLFGTLGYDRTVDCTTLDQADLEARVLAGFEARDTLRQEIAVALPRGLEKLDTYQTALADLMRRCAQAA